MVGAGLGVSPLSLSCLLNLGQHRSSLSQHTQAAGEVTCYPLLPCCPNFEFSELMKFPIFKDCENGEPVQ